MLPRMDQHVINQQASIFVVVLTDGPNDRRNLHEIRSRTHDRKHLHFPALWHSTHRPFRSLIPLISRSLNIFCSLETRAMLSWMLWQALVLCNGTDPCNNTLKSETLLDSIF